MSYKKLEIWKLACDAVITIHNMTIEFLPKFELYEEGSQIRRSIKSVKSNIVEGYGRRMYKYEFIRVLVYALASNDETIDYLETLFETNSLTNEDLYNSIHKQLELFGRKLNMFLQSVQKGHNSAK